MVDALSEIRRILDKYEDTYAVGETFLSTPNKAAQYCGEEALHQAFNFKFLESAWRAPRFGQATKDWEKALGRRNWPNYVLSNHDVPRAASRYGDSENDERLKVAATMLLTLRGTPFIYYGEEIGMRDIHLKKDHILDPVGRYYWPFYKGRDRCRAPMQWDASSHSGFSEGKPWLPLHPNWPYRNVESQYRQQGSLLNCYKELLSLRRQVPALRQGDISFINDLPAGVLGYERKLGSSHAVILLNFTKTGKTVYLQGISGKCKPLFSTRGVTASGDIKLRGDEGLVLMVNPD